jgi:chaperonin GroES
MEDWNVLYDKVLVRRDAAVEEKGGMVVPEKARRQQSQGTVVATGPGHPLPEGGFNSLTVRPGDKVKFTAFSGVPLDEDDEDLILVREAELLAYRREGV